MLHLHLVLGRICLKLLNIKSIVFFGYMYTLLDLRSIADEDASQNVLTKLYFLSLYLFLNTIQRKSL